MNYNYTAFSAPYVSHRRQIAGARMTRTRMSLITVNHQF